ncbi:hypothetical protein NDU88_006516 [Pleurodeles waltl]|uniref:Uncharacterized protein n=1 Tax=Pleurodeles waltl TaxID=8319 RepID=A0AAV7NVC4_PLEWA|nr:hypothetical protein NDU88_006516 [Pleurodeles waltl]
MLPSHLTSPAPACREAKRCRANSKSALGGGRFGPTRRGLECAGDGARWLRCARSATSCVETEAACDEASSPPDIPCSHPHETRLCRVEGECAGWGLVRLGRAKTGLCRRRRRHCPGGVPSCGPARAKQR